MRRFLTLTAIAVALIAVASAWPASGSITTNTFSATGEIRNEGRLVTLTAQLTCTEGQIAQIRATLSQGDSFAQDSAGADCTGAVQSFPLRLRAETNRFEAGTATVCGLALNRVRQQDRAPLVDTRQWCKDVTLAVV